jgi:hypothetical protein
MHFDAIAIVIYLGVEEEEDVLTMVVPNEEHTITVTTYTSLCSVCYSQRRTAYFS